LLREVHAVGYLATGRRHGVSDNAVRKWLRQYEREQAVAGELCRAADPASESAPKPPT
jgi:transposase-like protein